MTGRGQSDIGSIPASAGEPFSFQYGYALPEVYPRECGGTWFSARRVALRGCELRSIPASAGEPRRRWFLTPLYGLSPRVRGNPHGHVGARGSCSPGLSPRVRGNPRTNVAAIAQVGTGLSPRVRGNQGLPRIRHSTALCGLSPRVRGNPVYRRCERSELRGLSPRVRGNHMALMQRSKAKVYPRECGGTPWSFGYRLQVYPRECGGTLIAMPVMERLGLSPRVRGNHGPPLLRLGLSPRVRGNRMDGLSGGRNAGSIPASAGEPG